MKQETTVPVAQAWWRFGHVWLVLAGPAVVVVAGFITLWLAVRSPDPVVAPDYYRKGIEINQTLRADPSSLAPAVQARNHAQTGLTVEPAAEPREGARP
ncbi:MAG: FixH family protein [Curvibacter sp.]|jgi:hypothetical protein|nr:FixH family protein [Curvibacter sp.]